MYRFRISSINNLPLKSLFLIFFFNTVVLAQNTRWYISPTGSGTQDGKSRANARIYTNVNSLNIQPGDTVFVMQGIYTSQLDFNKDGAPGALITIMPDPQNTAEAVFSNPNDYAINITGQRYVRLYKLTIRNSKGGVAIGQGKVKFLDSLHISKNAGTGINIYGNNGGSYNPDYDPGVNSNVDSVFIRWCYVATDTQVNMQTDVITMYWAHGVRIIGNYLLQANYTGTGHNDCIQKGHGIGNIYIANNMLINLKEGDSQIMMGGNSWKGYKTIWYNNVSIHYGAGTGVWFEKAHNGFNPSGLWAADGESYIINSTFIGKRFPCVVQTQDYPQGSGNFLDSAYIVNNIFYMIQSDGSTPLTLPRAATESINALYADNNIHAINGGSSTQHITTLHANAFVGSWTLSSWNNFSPMKMYGSTTSLPTFRNFIYNSSLYYEEDLRLQPGSVGINSGRGDIKIKGNQWVNLKTLIESFGLEWKGFNNPYISWSNPVPRSETNPTIGAWEYTDGAGGNLPPDLPTNPSPANASSVQSSNITLSWNCSDPNGDPLVYDVYFGNNNNPSLVVQNYQSTNYNISNLTPGNTYYWRIVAKDNQGGIRSGNLWSFTVSSTDTTPPQLIGASLIDNVTLSLTFSENINPGNASNLNNYLINNGILINSALLNGNKIQLSTTPHAPGFYQITVTNLTDLAGNTINPNNNTLIYGFNPDTLLNIIKFSPFQTNASSVPDPNLAPTKTIDGLGYNSGDPNSRWAAPGLPQWIGYDLGSVIILNKTRVQFFRFSERTYQYSIQVSEDSVNWSEIRTNVSSVMGAEWDEQVLDPVPARYVRIIIYNNSALNNWASLWETEFYGQLPVSNEDNNSIPQEFYLDQNYPNPFNPTTKIRFVIPASSLNPFSKGEGTMVSLKVYDILGNEVATLVDENKAPGVYEVEFDANNLSSGVYLYKLQANDFVEVKKMILMR